MRLALKTLGILTLLAIGFVGGALTAGARHWFQPLAHITIKNDSGQDLSALTLTHSSSRFTSTVALPALKQGESTNFRFFIAGEGGYSIEAKFADGRVIKGGAGYVESGYKVTDVVGASKVQSKSSFY